MQKQEVPKPKEVRLRTTWFLLAFACFLICEPFFQAHDGPLFSLLQTRELILVSSILIYVFIVRILRYKRSEDLRARFTAGGKKFSDMTAEDAQSILKTLAELEFPKLYGLSMVVALFRTYGIPTISSLLVATGQLKNTETSSKRAADTGVLLLEFGLNKPTSERAIQAVARMNFLHSRYQKSGKITNDNMLYALSIFALEPARWINKYEWRSMTDVELCACGTYWRSMGDAMEISYTNLPSSVKGWQDGLHWLTEMEEWSDQYEKAHMVPADSNRRLADSQFENLLPKVPTRYRDHCLKMIIVLLGDRLRQSMMYPESPAIYYDIVNGALYARKLWLRYFALPRPDFLRNHWIGGMPNQYGRYFLFDYLAHPWYVRPSFAQRWGPRAWVTRLLGYKVPGDDGDKYFPQGYTFIEIGPQHLSGKGKEDMDKIQARLISLDRGRCPFSSMQ